MSNAKAHAFNSQMSTDARVRQLEDQLRERDETIVGLQGRIADLEARIAATSSPAPRITEASGHDAA